MPEHSHLPDEEPRKPERWREVLVSWQYIGTFALIWGVCVQFVQGPTGTIGYLAGLAGAGANNIFLWLAIKLTGMAADSDASARFGAGLTMVAFFLKLPLIFTMFFFVAKPMGDPAVNGFLNAMGLVYCVLIGWAQAKCEP